MKSHPSDESLVLYLLGDERDHDALHEHVQGCERCRAETERLRALLGRVEEMPVPEPDAGFEERIWARRSAALAERASETGAGVGGDDRAGRVVPFWSLGRLALTGAIAASLVVAFLAGLYMPRSEEASLRPEEAGPRGDRVLLVAVGDHLERTRMVLVELSNASDPEIFRAQQVQARSLIGDNRLYRQTARLSGQSDVAEVLDEVERVLLEVARSSDEIPAEELAWLRQRVTERDLLFKVSVIEGSARQGAERPQAPGIRGGTDG